MHSNTQKPAANLAIFAITAAAGFFTLSYLKKRQSNLNYENRKNPPYALGLMNAEEIIEPIELQISGQIPKWLEGVLFRNGPGYFDIETDKNKTFHFSHWFDGAAVLHKFNIQNGKVTYQNRIIAKPVINFIKTHGYVPLLFGEDPCASIFSKFSSFLYSLANTNTDISLINTPVTVGRFQDTITTKTDANAIKEIDWNTLESKRNYTYTDLSSELTGQLASAHTQYDHNKRELFNFVQEIGRNCTYKIFKVADADENGYSATNGVTILAKIQAESVYMHSFALTEHYFILIIHSERLSALKLLFNKNIQESISFDSHFQPHFYVISRDPHLGHVATFKATQPFFTFHNINAYETNNSIIIDNIIYDNGKILDNLSLYSMLNAPNIMSGYATRFTLDMTKASTTEIQTAQSKLIHGRGIELPRFNQLYHMKEYRYFYAIAGTTIFDHLKKVDIINDSEIIWRQEGTYPGEPIFLPNPGNNAEDDGILLSPVLDSVNKNNFLLILDAKTMKEIGRATIPKAVPFTFHGNFFGKDKKTTYDQ